MRVVLFALIGLFVASLASAQDAPPDEAVEACPDGQARTADTQGECCWPNQVFAGGRCRGAPSACPEGFERDLEEETCMPQAPISRRALPDAPDTSTVTFEVRDPRERFELKLSQDDGESTCSVGESPCVLSVLHPGRVRLVASRGTGAFATAFDLLPGASTYVLHHTMTLRDSGWGAAVLGLAALAGGLIGYLAAGCFDRSVSGCEVGLGVAGFGGVLAITGAVVVLLGWDGQGSATRVLPVVEPAVESRDNF